MKAVASKHKTQATLPRRQLAGALCSVVFSALLLGGFSLGDRAVAEEDAAQLAVPAIAAAVVTPQPAEEPSNPTAEAEPARTILSSAQEEITPEPEAAPEVTPTAEPAAEVAAEPSPEPSAGPAPEVSSAPEVAPAPEASTPSTTSAPPEASAAPSATPAPEPTQAPTAAPETTPTTAPTPELTPEPTPEPTPARKYQDGTFTGSGMGNHGSSTDIVVSVTILEDRITSIVITGFKDDPDYFDPSIEGARMIGQMLNSQSARADAVSGATYSSEGLIDAVRAALKSAEN